MGSTVSGGILSINLDTLWHQVDVEAVNRYRKAGKWILGVNCRLATTHSQLMDCLY